MRYTYDSRGRVDSIVGGNLLTGVTVGFRAHYDGANRRDSLVNNRTPWRESWTFDQDGQPTNHVWYDGGGLNPQPFAVNDAFTLRDAAGRLLQRTGLDGTFASVGGAGAGPSAAESIANQVARATGGVASALARSEGFKVTVSEAGRDIVARIKEGGDFRVAIEGLGALTRNGTISGDRALHT